VLSMPRKKHGVHLHFDHVDFASWDYYEKHAILCRRLEAKIGTHDAIYLISARGSAGPPKSPITFSLWGHLRKFRRGFDRPYVQISARCG